MKRLTMDFWRRVFKKQMNEVKPNDIWRLTMDRRIEFHSVEPGWTEAFQEHAHGRFTCSGCWHSWSSYQVLILFHIQWDSFERRGHVKMKRFGQRCHECSLDTYEEPQFSEDDVADILKDLILDIREKCYGEQVDRSQLSKVVCHEGGPHKREFCEGCQLGIHKGQQGRSKQAEHHGKPQSTGYPATIIQIETSSPSFPRSSAPSFTGSSAPSFPWSSVPSFPRPSAPSITGSSAPSFPRPSAPSFTGSLPPSSTGSLAPSSTGSSAPTQGCNYCLWAVILIIAVFIISIIIFIAYMLSFIT
ncbi:receptor-transporting protein 2-like [Podarcis raffonei]|uniref:receptor-transporting protein 2-like n=1 Tax=Podarcis raffonei TaxID=65483 RepID=UPI0023293EDC|nr:receptor-transporting protein 2-like [Podarcis raffonei]